MSTRGLERFAVVALPAAIALLVADRLLHAHGFLFLPVMHHRPDPWRRLAVLIRLRPALAAGFALLVAGLLAALVAGCAEIVRQLGGRERTG